MNHIDGIDPMAKDTYSLPDIALYSFDNISEAVSSSGRFSISNFMFEAK